MSFDHFLGHGRGDKQDLPHPYNQDLSKVIRRLDRRTALGRARLANDPVTASFLWAGMRLIRQHLGPGHRCECPSQHDGRSLLSFVSQRNVVATVAAIENPFRRPRGSVMDALRGRWKHQHEFVADLVAFAFMGDNYRPGYKEDLQDRTAQLVHDPDFVHAVQEISYLHTADSVLLPSVRLSLALMAAAEDDADVAEAITEAYAQYLGSWRTLYQKVMRARGLRLRTGVSLDDLTDALSAAADGVVLRALGDPAAGVLDHARRRTLLDKVVLAILYAFLERDDDSDGLPLEQVTARRLTP
jgi:hypothetical protein